MMARWSGIATRPLHRCLLTSTLSMEQMKACVEQGTSCNAVTSANTIRQYRGSQQPSHTPRNDVRRCNRAVNKHRQPQGWKQKEGAGARRPRPVSATRKLSLRGHQRPYNTGTSRGRVSLWLSLGRSFCLSLVWSFARDVCDLSFRSALRSSRMVICV